MPHTDTTPVSASIAVAATGLGIKHIGGKIWAGWSGEVIINNSTVDMFNFVTPNVGLIVTNFQYYINHSGNSPATNEYVGWILTLDSLTVVKNVQKATQQQHFNDFDKNSFVIPGNTKCVISSYTNTALNIPTYAMFYLKEIE